MKDIGLVIPTMGCRDNFLNMALKSISANSRLYVVLIAPRNIIEKYKNEELNCIDEFIEDEHRGLSAAINKAIEKLPKNIRYISWLGDDDALIYNNFERQVETLINFKKVVATYGKIYFIDHNNNIFWKLKPGLFANFLLKFGPNRIPQPGSLIRRSAFEEIGRLDEDLNFAFDTDMFIRLQKVGKIKYVDYFVAYFRWHKDSLSAGQSQLSLREASLVRKKNLKKGLKKVSCLWETPQLYLGIKLPNRIDIKSQNFKS